MKEEGEGGGGGREKGGSRGRAKIVRRPVK